MSSIFCSPPLSVPAEVFAHLPSEMMVDQVAHARNFAALAFADSEISAAQAHAHRSAIAKLKAAGVRIEPVALPHAFADARSIAETLVAYEAAAIFAPLLRDHPSGVAEHLQLLVQRGRSISAPRYR